MNQRVKPSAIKVVPINEGHRVPSDMIDLESPVCDLVALGAALRIALTGGDGQGMVHEGDKELALEWLSNEIYIKARDAKTLFYDAHDALTGRKAS